MRAKDIVVRRRRSTLLLILLIALTIVFIATLDTYITVGVNGNYREVHMPLYVKCTQFLGRHYEYARLAEEITAGCTSQEERALAILKWTRERLRDAPAGMPFYDDHILNIIIRSYAVPEQFQEVFSTLCAYSGLPSFYERVYSKNYGSGYVLSFVMIDGKWRMFDAYAGIYFRTRTGELASIDDIIKEPSLVKSSGIVGKMSGDVSCEDYYMNVLPVERPVTLRADKQMPVPRLAYEIRKAIGFEKEGQKKGPVKE